MSICPNCGADISEGDLQAGKCPACNHALTSGDSREKLTVDVNQILGTVQFERRPLPPRPSMRKKRPRLGDIAKTMLVSPSSQPPASGPSAESQRFAQTYDSDRFSAESDAKVSNAWPSNFEQGATPRTSIKADAPAGGEPAKAQHPVARAPRMPTPPGT